MPSTAAYSLPVTPPPIPMRAPNPNAWGPSGKPRDPHERLFELRREAIARSTQQNPLARTAALLLSIASNNSYEGRDPTSVPDTLSSGFVADLLGMDLDELAHVLTELEFRGLIEPGSASTLCLKDMAGLAALADAH